MRIIVTLFAALWLSGCESSVETSPATARTLSAKDGGISVEINRRCRALEGTPAVVFSTGPLCPACSATDVAQAVDGRDETAASLDAGPGEPGEMILRAGAQPGVSYPAGVNAAVVLSAADDRRLAAAGGISVVQSSQNWQVTFTTLLGDAVQERVLENVSLRDDPDQRLIVGLTTTQPYDGIEVRFDRSGLATGDGNFGLTLNATDYITSGNALVHEFCADFDLSGLQ